MANVSASNSSNTTCIKAINETLFDLGCLGPALAIIVILACLKQRKTFKLEYCNGYPGLLIPVNFLGSLHNSHRFTIAATFGATASTCLQLFMSPHGIFVLGGPPWLKVFQGIITVLVYGILFYPLFTCLTTEYKLVGSFLGFLYVSVRFCFQVAITFQCWSNQDAANTTLLILVVVSNLPTYFCLVFILIKFAVLLCSEVQKKWFQSTRCERVERARETCLVGEPEIMHVKQLLSPESSMVVMDVKWYKRLIYFIYKPRADFKFSTQFISTLLVAAIILFQICVLFFSLFDYANKRLQPKCAGDHACLGIFDVMFGSLEATSIIAALISAMMLLHFMKCHRDHVLQLYRGQRTFYQGVSVSPALLVGRSLRFSGYQIAYTLAGYFVLGFILAFVCLLLGFIFKYIKVILSPAMFEVFKQSAIALLPTVGMVIFLLLFQLFLAYFVFRDRDFPNITITVDNRRLFSIMAYFFFFYNILLGLFSSLGRIFKGMVLGVVFLSRIDRTSLMQGFQTWDQAFVAYLGFINVLVAHSHPVMLVFCQLLINRNEDRGLEESLPVIRYSVQNEFSLETGRATGYTREFRLPRRSHKATNRWYVAVTLLRNPSVMKYRKQGGVKRAASVNLGSINADLTALV